MKTLLTTVFLIVSSFILNGQQKTFNVDFSKPLERIKDLGGVNGGFDVLPPMGQSKAGTAVEGYKKGGVSFIRTHDITGLQYFEYAPTFWKEGKINPAFNPVLESSYQWINADKKIDSIVIPGFTPYFRLGINYNSAKDIYSAAPKDPDGINFSKFAEVCKRTLLHYNKDWPTGKGKTLGIKYWEIWNEPDGGFWRDSINAVGMGDSVAFVKMYKAVYDSMKKADPNIKVGGPGVLSGTVISRRSWLNTFLDECRKNKAGLDFFSWHLYGALNPYAIATEGEYVRTLLNSYGFNSAENHVTENNIRLGEVDVKSPKPLINTPKHGAYTASVMISAQFGEIDRLFCYRGTSFMNLFGEDSLNTANPTLSGQGFSAFNELARFTPQRIAADSSEFVTSRFSSQVDTTNIMILAGRSDDQKRFYVLISNYNSKYKSIAVNISNLAKLLTGTLTLKKTVMNSSGTMSETSETIQSGTNITASISNFTAPAFALLRFNYQEPTSVEENRSRILSFNLSQNYPNPFNPSTVIRYQVPTGCHVILKIYDVLGREIKTLVDGFKPAGTYSETVNAATLTSGIYYYQLKSGNDLQTKKMMVVK